MSTEQQDRRESFSEWFHLKDSGRSTFELDQERDAHMWCTEPDLERRLRSGLEAGLRDEGVPRLILYGEYGTGKTHALNHCKWLVEKQLRNTQNVIFRHHIWSGFDRRTRFLDIYRETLDKALGMSLVRELVRSHFQNNSYKLHLPRELDEALGQDQDLVTTLRELAQPEHFPGMPAAKKTLVAWRWLKGLALSSSERGNLGVSASLSERTTPVHLVRILELIGYLLKAQRGQRLVLLFDEGEQFNNLPTEGRDDIAAAIRALFERQRQYVGILLAFWATREGPGDLIRSDVYSRLNPDQQVFELATLNQVEARRAFISAVLRELTKDDVSADFPFEPAALTLVSETCERLVAGLEVNLPGLYTSRREVTPRTVLIALNRVARLAYDLQVRPISEAFLRTHFPHL